MAVGSDGDVVIGIDWDYLGGYGDESFHLPKTWSFD